MRLLRPLSTSEATPVKTVSSTRRRLRQPWRPSVMRSSLRRAADPSHPRRRWTLLPQRMSLTPLTPTVAEISMPKRARPHFAALLSGSSFQRMKL